MIVLIDGNNTLCRAYYAINSKAPNRSGYDRNEALKASPTAGAHGFLTILFSLVRKFEPECVYVAWDAGRDAARTSLFPDYKAGRRTTAEAQEASAVIEEQIGLLHRDLLPLLGVPQVRFAGREADDLIAAATRILTERSKRVVYIVSNDGDLFQLVDRGTRIVPPTKIKGRTGADGSIGLEDFFEATHFATPAHYLAAHVLSGDSSDNIPSVAGIGEKTAQQMVEAYGDLNGILAAKEQIEALGSMAWRMKKLFSAEGLQELARNIQLIDLTNGPRLDDEILEQFAAGGVVPPSTYSPFKDRMAELGHMDFAMHENDWARAFTKMRERWDAVTSMVLGG